MIKTITAQGLKGFTFSEQFEPATVITGANWSGKTARLDAIRLALAGHVPRLGKLPKKTLELANGKKLSVTATFEPAIHGIDAVERVFKRTEKGGTLKSATFRNGEEAGKEFEWPVIALDPAEYFGKTPKEKADLVFAEAARLSDSGTGEPANLFTEKVQAISTENDEQDKVISEIVAEIEKDEYNREEAGDSSAEWLGYQVEKWQKRLKDAKAWLDSHQGTVDNLLQKEAQERGNGRPAGKIKAELDQAEAELEERRKECSRLEAQIGQAKKRIQELEEQKQKADAEAKQDGIPAPEKAESDFNTLKSKYDEIAAEFEKARNPGDESRQAERELERARLTLTSRQNDLQIAQEEERDLDQAEACPHCGSSGDSWKENLRSKIHARKSALQEEIQALAQTADQAQKDVERLQAEEDHYMSLYQKKLDTANELAKLKTVYDRALNKSEQAGSLDKIEKELAEQQQTVIDTEEKKSEAMQKASVAREKVDQLTKEMDQAKAKQEHQRLKQEAIDKRDDAQAKVDVLNEVTKAVKAVKQQAVDSLIESLDGVMNEFISGVIPGRITCQDGVITYVDEKGQQVPTSGLSGVQESLVYAATCCALASRAPVKLVLLDEMGRFDSTNKIAVVDRMQTLIERRVIDQFIGVDTKDWSVTYNQTGVHTLEL